MSNEFKWSDDFGIGIEEIDLQHKQLFELLERLCQAVLEKQGPATCAEIFDALIANSRVHFVLEESLMRLSRYAEVEAHQRSHRDLLTEIEQMYRKIHNCGGSVSLELLRFLRNWLTKHILNEDMAYAKHFAASGFGQSEQPAPAMAVSEAAAPARRKWWQFW